MANEYAEEMASVRGSIEYEKAAKTGEVERPLVVALRRTGNMGDELAMVVTTLEERLRPVLAQPLPEPPARDRDGGDVRMQHGDSDVVNQVNAQAQVAEMQIQRLYRLLDRLEV